MDLQAHVLAAAEGAADAGEGEPHLLPGQVEAGGDLVAVVVQPLGRDEQLDPAVLGSAPPAPTPGRGRPGPACPPRTCPRRPRRRSRPGRRARMPDVAEHVAVRVDRRRRRSPPRRPPAARAPRTRPRSRRRRGRRAPGGRRRPRRSARRGSARRSSANTGWSWCSRPYVREPGTVVLRHDGVHAGHGECAGDVDPEDARVRVRAAQRLAPDHAVDVQVGGERELAPDLGRARPDAARSRRGPAPGAGG